MKFLDRVAEDIYRRSGGAMEDVCVVFPNKRAGLFFSDHLKKYMTGSGWLPKLMTIEEFFGEHSSLAEADPLVVNFELYRLFSSHMGSGEDFDQFYSWGNMLVKDFDEADKYLVNADDLFQVMLEEKEIIANFSYLTEEQVEIIKRFWNSFSPPDFSEGQRSFLRVWEILRPVYHQLNETLKQQGIGYQGMIYREVAQKARNKEIDTDRYKYICFVGFHILTEAETIVFHHLQKSGKVLFYWDIDTYYIENEHQEAGKYLRNYVKRFRSALPPVTQVSNTSKKIEVVGIPLHSGQAKYVAKVLEEIHPEPIDTAVVLPDENLLFPVLHALPGSIGNVNITMGYPVKNTYAYTLVNDLIELQRYRQMKEGVPRFYYKPFFRLLANPLLKLQLGNAAEDFIRKCREENRIYIYEADIPEEMEIIRRLYVPAELAADHLAVLTGFTALFLEESEKIASAIDPVQQEFIFQVHTQVKKLQGLIRRHGIHFKKETLFRILRQDLKTLRIPFSGEPLNGLQVMGLLETRNLDFKNLFILDMNEGVFPSETQPGSFIPYHLRKGFGLPTYEHQDAMFAYYFYRLLHHAENIYLLYNTQADGQHKSELSRYVTQLRYESAHTLQFRSQSQPFTRYAPVPVTIPKSPEIMSMLERYTENAEEKNRTSLSPSALNTYLDCRLKFYYRYIAGIDEPDTMVEEIDAATFGNLIHHTMENLYTAHLKDDTERLIRAEDFISLEKGIPFAIESAFREVFRFRGEVEFTGDNLVVRDVVDTYVNEILKLDKAYAPFRILGMEGKSITGIAVNVNGKEHMFRVGGRIDRLDQKEGITRILDYKTGAENGKSVFTSVDALFEREDEKRKGYVFQVMLYAYVVKQLLGGQAQNVQPGLLFVRDVMQNNTDTRVTWKPEKEGVPVDDIRPFEQEFSERLKEVLHDLMDSAQPFSQVENEKICEWCPYKGLCHR